MTAPFHFARREGLQPSPVPGVDDAVVHALAHAGGHADGYPPLLTVAWLPAPHDTLDEVVAEELVRARSAPGSVLVDYEPVTVDDRPAVRSLLLHRTADGTPTATEQWRLLADGHRWTISAMTALVDQALFGPVLATIAVSLRIDAAR